MVKNKKNSLKFFNFREKFLKIAENSYFEWFMFAIILLSAVLIGVETFDINPKYLTLLKILDYAITIIFLIEIILKISIEKRKLDFFKSGWNVFDFLIVTLSLIPIPNGDFVLIGRLLRIFRILRIIKALPELKRLISALIRSLPNIFYISLLLFVILYIYAAIGTFMFKEINPALWGNIAISLLTMFNLMTFDGWGDIMSQTMAVYPIAWTFFVSYALITVFTFLNLFIGAILSSIEADVNKDKEEADKQEMIEVKKLQEKVDRLEKKIDILLEKKY